MKKNHSVTVVAAAARARYRAKTARLKAETETRLGQSREEVSDVRKSRKQAKSRLFWMPPRIPDRSKKLNMTTWGKIWLTFVLLFGCFLLFMEQGANSTVLVDLGVFGIRTMFAARCFLCSAAAAGFVLGLVTGKLPMVMRARLTVTLVAMLVMSLAGLIPSIAANVGIAASISNQPVNFDINIDDEQLEEVSESSTDESPFWSWIMFSCSLASICFTSWLMELYREQIIYEATPTVDNEDFKLTELAIATFEDQLNELNADIAEDEGDLAEIAQGEELAVLEAIEKCLKGL